MQPAADDRHEHTALAGLAAQGGDDLQSAARRLFTGESFVVSDVRQVGNPIVHASPEFEALTLYPVEELLGRDVGFLMRDDTDQPAAAEARTAALEGRSASAVVRSYRADGRLFYAEQRHYPVKDSAGAVAFVVTLVADVTDRVHASAAQEVARELNATLEGDGRFFHYALLLKDDGGVEVAWASDSFGIVTGYSVPDLVDSGFARFVHEDDRVRFAERLTALRQHDRRVDQYRMVSQGGSVVWVEDFAVRRWRSEEAGVTAVYGVAQDVTMAKRGASEMWRLAHVDPLTGLPNAYLLEDRVQQAQLQARRNGQYLALAILDLDHFRFVNQTFSRKRGDRLLLELSRRLRRTLRRTDTLARWGGDSFALLLADLPHRYAVLPALRKAMAAIEEPFEDGALSMQLAASVGVDIYPDPDELRPSEGRSRTAAAMIERATEALRRAKETRPGSYTFFDDEVDELMHERVRTEAELREALATDQLVLHYQPRIDLATGAIHSVEALVRWLHPERGLLKPADFLPLAEEVQLGQALFEWVLDTACRQAKRWQEERVPRRVAVNISPQALERHDLAATVKAALQRHDLHPALLEIEVSERTALATLEANVTRLGELREMGVRVALDDFGVAQASLQHLRELPLDGLKIDRSFVARLGEQAPGGDVDLLRAIIGIGKSLKLRVTAEGVETRAQNALLRSLRCDEGQGYLFSQPVPAEYVPVVA
jgi:diguanylate cyclase (GGDEF)-like protein/PAS domain S-box-containing protein